MDEKKTWYRGAHALPLTFNLNNLVITSDDSIIIIEPSLVITKTAFPPVIKLLTDVVSRTLNIIIN